MNMAPRCGWWRKWLARSSGTTIGSRPSTPKIRTPSCKLAGICCCWGASRERATRSGAPWRPEKHRYEAQYWLGWSDFWNGDRDAANGAWSALGFANDSASWRASLDSARRALAASDTAAALDGALRAIRFGVRRPASHVFLGELLNATDPKAALLEWKVAVTLDPRDAGTRRTLAAGLAAAGLPGGGE
jgi:hypothetical protein